MFSTHVNIQFLTPGTITFTYFASLFCLTLYSFWLESKFFYKNLSFNNPNPKINNLHNNSVLSMSQSKNFVNVL